MKIEIDNTFTKKRFYESIVEQEKQDFLKIMKKLQVQEGKKFNVQVIAAKIARGESVSSEELIYIKENAPALFEEAKRQNRERVRNEKDENDKSKEVKQTNSSNQVSDESKNDNVDSTKTDGESVKIDNNSSASVVINKSSIG